MLGRGYWATSNRARRLGVGCRERDGWYTLTEVCEILGVHSTWLRKRIDSGALPASHHHGEEPRMEGLASWHIKEFDLRRFIIRYSKDLLARNVDLPQIVAILVGAPEMKTGRLM